MILLRILQGLMLVFVWVGLLQIPALSAEIRVAMVEHTWDVARLGGRLAAVTGPSLLAALIMHLLELTIRGIQQQRALRSAHPSQPWLQRPQWAAKHIRLSNRPALIGLTWFFVIYVGVAVPLAIASQKLPFMIFAGVVGGMALLFLRMMWLSRKWNRAELRISTLPGVIGGPFSGAVILHETFPPGTIFDVNLKCESARTSHHHKKTRVIRNDLWSSTIYVQKPLPGSPPGTTAIPVSFAIPFSARATGSDNDETIRWTLSIQKKEEVSTGGACFEVPVFRTSDSRSDYEHDEELIGEHLAVFDPRSILARFGLREQLLPDGSCILHFREFDLSIFLTLIVMGLMLVGVLVAMWYWIKDGNTMFFAMMFPVVFLLMMIYGVLHMLLWRCRIELMVTEPANRLDSLAELHGSSRQPRTIVAQSGWWGWRKSIRVPVAPTTTLRCKLDHRANNQESWSIWLQGADQSSLKLMSTFKSASEASRAASFLGEKLGVAVFKIHAEDGYLSAL